MTSEQLEELLGKVTEWPPVSGHENAYDATLIALAPFLAKRVIAAEKLVDDAETVMHELIVNSSWSYYEVNKLLSEITAYREVSK